MGLEREGERRGLYDRTVFEETRKGGVRSRMIKVLWWGRRNV